MRELYLILDHYWVICAFLRDGGADPAACDDWLKSVNDVLRANSKIDNH